MRMAPIVAGRTALRLATCALMGLSPAAGHGQVYVGQAAGGGGIVLSNFRSEATPSLLQLSAEEEPQRPAAMTVRVESGPVAALPPRELRELVDSVARRVGISPRLLHAVISVESAYRPDAVSPRGAVGLMQLLPATARRFGVGNPYIPHDNVYAGANYLKWLNDYFDHDMELVLAAYNAGENAVIRAGRRAPDYRETQEYVRRVIAALKG
jgi:soluble lytic murein transglycosylase-like protein